jgi:hypothetical protein
MVCPTIKVAANGGQKGKFRRWTISQNSMELPSSRACMWKGESLNDLQYTGSCTDCFHTPLLKYQVEFQMVYLTLQTTSDVQISAFV